MPFANRITLEKNITLEFKATNGSPIHYVYPRLKTFLKSKKVKAETFSDKASISRNTLSKIFSGIYVTDEVIEKCATAAKTLFGDEFVFENERMPAQGTFVQSILTSYIGNQPYDEVAGKLGIPKYLLQWIVDEKKISEEIANAIIINAHKN